MDNLEKSQMAQGWTISRVYSPKQKLRRASNEEIIGVTTYGLLRKFAKFGRFLCLFSKMKFYRGNHWFKT